MSVVLGCAADMTQVENAIETGNYKGIPHLAHVTPLGAESIGPKTLRARQETYHGGFSRNVIVLDVPR